MSHLERVEGVKHAVRDLLVAYLSSSRVSCEGMHMLVRVRLAQNLSAVKVGRLDLGLRLATNIRTGREGG